MSSPRISLRTPAYTLGLGVICIGAAMASGCKPPSDSSTKSLDNYAGGAFTENTCSGNQPVTVEDARLEGSATERTGIRTALSSIPAALQDAFFKELNGKVVVSANIGADCTDPAKANVEAAKGLISCWQTPTPSSAALYIKKGVTDAETAKNISHATVRAFGYLLYQFMLKLQNTADGSVLGQNQSLEQMLSDLTAAVLVNVAANPAYKLSAFASKLPASVLAAGLSDDERRQAWQAVAASPAGRNFAEEIAAETFDSFHCSQTSKTKLVADFKRDGANVAEMMAEIDAAIVAVFGAPKGASLTEAQASDDAGDGTGLGLWGRWGWGNGPIRQAFSNWGDYRASGRGFFNFRRASQGGGWIFNRGGWGATWE